MFLIQKYTQYKAAQAEQQKRKVTEKELAHLNHKIDKLLSKLDEHEPEVADNQDEECVVCVNAKATMQTYPCGHRVVCRKCFVKTIQMAVAQRLLPLRCVLCRAKILRLKHANGIPLASSASQYTIGSQWYHVPQSSSLYSVTSSTSGISGVSGVSSASSCSSASSYKTCASGFSSASLKKRSYCKQGYQPLRTSSPSPSRSPQNPTTPSAANHQIPSAPKKDNHGHRVAPVEGPAPISIASGGTTITAPGTHPPKGKLSLIQEFQREFRNGKLKSAGDGKGSSGSHRSGGSTRIKCARLLVNQAQESTTSVGVKVDGSKRVKGDVLARSTSSASGVGGTSSSSSAFSGKSSAASGSSAGFRRATPPPPPPSSQSCHSFRLSRHDTVTPAPSALKSGKLLAFECSPVSDAKEIRSSTSSGNEIKTKLAKSGVCGTSSEEKPLLPVTIPPPQSAKRIVSPKK